MQKPEKWVSTLANSKIRNEVPQKGVLVTVTLFAKRKANLTNRKKNIFDLDIFLFTPSVTCNLVT